VGTKPLAFNEGLGLPDTQYPNTDGYGPPPSPHPRTDEEVRSEALEFITSGGGLFDGYSANRGFVDPSGSNGTTPVSVALINELKKVANVLIPGGTGVNWFDGMAPASCCAGTGCSKSPTGPWCWNMPAYGTLDAGSCGGTPNIYWSTISNTGTYKDQSAAKAVTAADALLYVHHGQQAFFRKDLNPPPNKQEARWAGGYQATQCPTLAGTHDGYNLDELAYTAPGQVTGCYSEIWINPKDGSILNQTPAFPLTAGADPMHIQYKPAFSQDILLHLKYLPNYRVQGTSCVAASMTAVFTPRCTNLGCTFDGSGSTGSISSYAWDWGDSTSSTMTTSGAPHTFTAPGHYVVSLTVSDGLGDSSVVGQQLTVTSQPPTPSFTVSCNQMSCLFNGSNSNAGDASITGYLWSFGDANFANGPALTTTTNTYAFGGVYTVSLTLTDSFGVIASTTQTVTVTGPPEALFAVICAGTTCAFDGSSSTGDTAIQSYTWTFGDGPPSGTGTGVNPTYAYKGSGTYTVTLTVTDANGQTGSITDAIDVYGPPSANFTFSCPSTGLQCTFYSSSVPAAGQQLTTWTWDFGDGTVVTNPTLTQTGQPELAWQPQYTYAAPGRYTVTLTVTDTAGNTASIALAVLANITPTAGPVTTSTVRDIPVTIDVLAYASDADRDPLSIANVTLLQAYPGASYQVIQLPSGRWGLSITPPNAFVGTLTFTYQACDSWGACSSPATVTVTVISAIVMAVGDQFYCPQNGSIQIPVATLLANDYVQQPPPPQPPRTLSVISYDKSILMGTLNCTSTVCTYTPPTNAAGYTFFRYTVSDNGQPTGDTDTAPVRIYVGYPDQAPTASDIFLTTTWNTPTTFTFNDLAFKAATDADGDSLTIGLLSQRTAFGNLVCSTPMYTCTYTPNTGYAGTDRFAYTASDEIHPAVTAWINVLTLPSPTPTFDARGGVVFTYENQSTWIGNGILANDYLPNGGPETVTSINTSGLVGSLTNCSASGCTYTPPFYYQGTTSFSYTATDSHGGTDSAVVKICVGCTNHAPVAVPQTLATPTNKILEFSVFDLMLGDYDPDNDPLTVTVYGVTAKLGTLNCGTPNYWCVYTPNVNATGYDVITYALSDGQTWVTSTVTIKVGP
jgi:PKD repeat protein